MFPTDASRCGGVPVDGQHRSNKTGHTGWLRGSPDPAVPDPKMPRKGLDVIDLRIGVT
jgi:hypothetical protein